jgi:SWI/SNF-related matrix-associated actin-dependent regulator 1 of chromatin subfamily A
MIAPAFQHQRDGAIWLSRRHRAILGDVPGLGKTRTILLAANGQPLGVICPASAIGVWENEAALLGLPTPALASIDLVTRRGVDWTRDFFAKRALVVDEFHRGRIMTAQRTKLLFSSSGLMRQWLDPVWLVSGTPAVRHPMDLWPALSAGWPQMLAAYGIVTAEGWEARTCEVTTRMVRRGARYVSEKKIVGVKDAAFVREVLSRCMLRRTLDDVGLDVPEIFHQELPVAVKLDAADDAIASKLYFDAAMTSEGLEALADDPHWARYRRHLGEAKVIPVIDMLYDELLYGEEKVVVFAHHRSVLNALARELICFGVAYIDGDTPPHARSAEIARFQNSPACRIFVGQNHACMESITLTAASRCVLLEPDPVAGVNAQLVRRIARIGSTARHCIAQWVAAEKTIDRQIIAQNIRETRDVERITPSTGET